MERSGSGQSKYQSIGQWFKAAEELGEFIGIRFGHLPAGTSEPSWHYFAHSDFDGIGAFAEILRRADAEVKQLPQIKYYPAYSAVGAALKHWPRYLLPRHPVAWGLMEKDGSVSNRQQPPNAVAWHVFDEDFTQRIRLESRKNGYTVNTLLLKALTDAIRPSLLAGEVAVPWMVPVNMRGGVKQFRDTDNHTSYVAIRVAAGQSAFNIHHIILRALSRGEHWGNWHAVKLGRCLTQPMRVFLVKAGLCMSQWSLGAFSNLGEWDPDKRITKSQAAGPWLFCPPTLRSQMLAAGCVTYQGRLSLTIQAHPELTTSIPTVRGWIQRWVTEISQFVSAAPVDFSWVSNGSRSYEGSVPRALRASPEVRRPQTITMPSRSGG